MKTVYIHSITLEENFEVSGIEHLNDKGEVEYIEVPHNEILRLYYTWKRNGLNLQTEYEDLTDRYRYPVIRCTIWDDKGHKGTRIASAYHKSLTNDVAEMFPPEMAEKRAFDRAFRDAFGIINVYSMDEVPNVEMPSIEIEKDGTEETSGLKIEKETADPTEPDETQPEETSEPIAPAIDLGIDVSRDEGENEEDAPDFVAHGEEIAGAESEEIPDDIPQEELPFNDPDQPDLMTPVVGNPEEETESGTKEDESVEKNAEVSAEESSEKTKAAADSEIEKLANAHITFGAYFQKAAAKGKEFITCKEMFEYEDELKKEGKMKQSLVDWFLTGMKDQPGQDERNKELHAFRTYAKAIGYTPVNGKILD